MERRGFLREVLHFAGWRRWGMFVHNPVLENSFVLFALALLSGATFAEFAPEYLLFLLLSLTLFSFGYLLNDAVDRERDAAFRSDNPFQGSSARRTVVVVVVAFLCQLPLVVFFQLRHPVFGAVWLAWLAAAVLYSIPFAYLKGRGWIGLVDVTLALRTLPACLAVAVFPSPAEPSQALVLAYVTARGLSADVAHQALHAAEDQANGVRTLAVRLGPVRAAGLLGALLRIERALLVAVAAWLPLHPGGRTFPALEAVALWGNLGLILALTLYAEVHVARGVGPNPHRPDQRNKDVFYLLHKSYPKVALPLLLVLLLAAGDARWLLLLAPQLLVYRVFSMRRILGAMRIRPTLRSP